MLRLRRVLDIKGIKVKGFNVKNSKLPFFTSDERRAHSSNWDSKKRKVRTASRNLKKRKAPAASGDQKTR